MPKQFYFLLPQIAYVCFCIFFVAMNECILWFDLMAYYGIIFDLYLQKFMFNDHSLAK